MLRPGYRHYPLWANCLSLYRWRLDSSFGRPTEYLNFTDYTFQCCVALNRASCLSFNSGTKQMCVLTSARARYTMDNTAGWFSPRFLTVFYTTI
jgi:hypothetical protein